MPDKVQIGPLNYEITTDATYVIATQEETNSRVFYGSHDRKWLRIVISSYQAADQMADTLLHEVLHGIFYTAGLADAEGNEKVIQVLSPFLLDTLRRNPALVAYLMTEDD